MTRNLLHARNCFDAMHTASSNIVTGDYQWIPLPIMPQMFAMPIFWMGLNFFALDYLKPHPRVCFVKEVISMIERFLAGLRCCLRLASSASQRDETVCREES